MEGGASRLYQGHCSGCAVLLMFPSGSSAVECARCGVITSKGRCTGCGITLMYPPGSLSVECAICGAVSQFGNLATEAASDAGYMAYLSCAGCNVQLMYPRTADKVKCSICAYISPTTIPLDASRNMIVIQNPDENAPDAFAVGYVPESREALFAQEMASSGAASRGVQCPHQAEAWHAALAEGGHAALAEGGHPAGGRGGGAPTFAGAGVEEEYAEGGVGGGAGLSTAGGAGGTPMG
ncbi:hypothetical protein T484DRAFT_1949155 [Baffinella frigidus]|nr:hypothetical protein T484DRAFT_1949155 [Cryptophyta sp. CCMP2293]